MPTIKMIFPHDEQSATFSGDLGSAEEIETFVTLLPSRTLFTLFSLSLSLFFFFFFWGGGGGVRVLGFRV